RGEGKAVRDDLRARLELEAAGAVGMRGGREAQVVAAVERESPQAASVDHLVDCRQALRLEPGRERAAVDAAVAGDRAVAAGDDRAVRKQAGGAAHELDRRREAPERQPGLAA